MHLNLNTEYYIIKSTNYTIQNVGDIIMDFMHMKVCFLIPNVYQFLR